MIKRILLIYVLLLAHGNTLFAQNQWNLNQCIAYAIKNNIGLKQKEVDEKLATEDFRQAKRDLLPAIGASSRSGFGFGRSVDPYTNDIVNTRSFSNSYDLNASVDLFNGFRMINQIEYQKFKKKAAGLNRLKATDELAFKVMGSYFDVIYCQGLLKNSEKQVEISGTNLRKMERQVELGIKSKPELLELKANYEGEVLKRIKAGNSLTLAKLALKQDMNLPDSAQMELVEEIAPMVSYQAPDAHTLFSSFSNWSPGIQGIEEELKASRKQLAISRSQLYPSISASASIGSAYYNTNRDNTGKTISFGNQLNNNLSQGLSASVGIPLFGKWGMRSAITKARLNIEQAKHSLEEGKISLYHEIVACITELEAYEKEYVQYQKQNEADRLAFQAAAKRMEHGLVSIVDYYIAKNKLATSEVEMLNSRLQWEIKKKYLDFYSGTRFWESIR